MEMEGFKTSVTKKPDGAETFEYRPLLEPRGRVIRSTHYVNGDCVLEYLEYGEIPGATPGERVGMPKSVNHLEPRLLKAMAVHHFGAIWLEDGFTEVDVEMIGRGFEIGGLPTGDAVWCKRENGTVLVVKRCDDTRLPGSMDDRTQMGLKGSSGAQLSVTAVDLRSMLGFLDAKVPYSLYNPRSDVNLEEIYTTDRSYQ